jgi:hypothetical protein
MKKSAIVLFFAGLFSLQAMAQTIQEGVAHLLAERYMSARQSFEKLTTANPNNLEAVYWMGQTLWPRTMWLAPETCIKKHWLQTDRPPGFWSVWAMLT